MVARLQTLKLARHAMATRFEFVLEGSSESHLRSAGEEALEDIERLENQLSLFRPSSEIARVNALAAREPVKVSPPVMSLLKHARQLHEESRGTFDITIAPLVRCWGFLGGTGTCPTPAEVAEARECTGMHLVELDQQKCTVRFKKPGVMLDLGAIGKGYALDVAVELLRDAGIESALIHGGTSTVYAIGVPHDAPAWKVAIEGPPPECGFPAGSLFGANSESPMVTPPFTLELQDEAMSVSAVWGKFFKAEGKLRGHLLDPRTGYPAEHAVLAAIAVKSATEADALSTALLVSGPDGHARIQGLRPGTRTVLVSERQGQLAWDARGFGVPPHTAILG